MSVELVEVVRSGFREGVHRGSVVVLGADGSVELQRGDVDIPVFPRSSNKPLQAVGMLRGGFTPPDAAALAIASGSHTGEAEHVRRVLELLASVGLGEDDLRCPADLPADPPTRHALLAAGGGARRAYMNCSGKHAGMLATCRVAGWDTSDYLSPDHPLQRLIAATIAELTGEPVAAVGVDGCGAPVLAVSLTGLARSFARLVVAPDGHERRVADAVRAHPFLVSGTHREDLVLMGAVPGLLSKMGAEGVHAAALPDGRAFALKIDDGAERGRGPVVTGLLGRLGVPTTPELDALSTPPLLGGGAVVGHARLVEGLW